VTENFQPIRLRDSIVYELPIGTFTPAGTNAAMGFILRASEAA